MTSVHPVYEGSFDFRELSPLNQVCAPRFIKFDHQVELSEAVKFNFVKLRSINEKRANLQLRKRTVCWWQLNVNQY